MFRLIDKKTIADLPPAEARKLCKNFVWVKEVSNDGTATVCLFDAKKKQLVDVEDTHTRDLGEIESRTRDLSPKQETKVLNQLKKYDEAKNEKQKSKAL